MKFYALWETRGGLRVWDGPFDTNTEARSFLDRTDTSGGSVITTGIPMTPGEAREASRLERKV